jgi:hypothetical protein
MRIQIEIGEDDLKRLIVDSLSDELQTQIAIGDVKIEVKSKQNYRSEWETASFRATINKTT